MAIKNNRTWIKWLYDLWAFIQSHTGGVAPESPATGTSWNAHGNTATGTMDVVGPLSVSGYFQTAGGRKKKVSRYVTTQTILATDEVVFCNTDAAAWTATLLAGIEGQSFRIINSGDSGNILTLAPDGTEHLLGVNTDFDLYDGEALELTYSADDGWY